jgi:hypothetical protein
MPNVNDLENLAAFDHTIEDLETKSLHDLRANAFDRRDLQA